MYVWLLWMERKGFVSTARTEGTAGAAGKRAVGKRTADEEIVEMKTETTIEETGKSEEKGRKIRVLLTDIPSQGYEQESVLVQAAGDCILLEQWKRSLLPAKW